MTSVLVASGITLGLNYGVHLASSIVYDKLCVPQSIWDIPYSMVATASPVCSFLVSTIQLTQTNYASVLSTTVAASLVNFLKP
jgi:hypothetical protein